MAHLVQDSVIELIKTKRFYGEFLLNMKVQYSTRIPTAGVNVTENINLIINPYFWQSLTLTEQAAVLEHECRHVLSDHFTRGKNASTATSKGELFVERQIMNIAMDLAINETIPNLPKNMRTFDPTGKELTQLDKDGKQVFGHPCTVEGFKARFPNIKHNETFEYYYDLIREELKKDAENGKGTGGEGQTIDDHDIWDEGNPNQEVVKRKIQDAANQAARQCEAGNIPGDIKELIDKLNYVPKDWKRDLRNFIASSISSEVEASRSIRNRRYGLMYAGYRKLSKLNLVAILDSSGSMYMDLVNQCFAELNQIQKTMPMVITLIQCDAEVRSIEHYDPKKPMEVIGRGGTAFNPAFEAAKKLKPDAIMYFTDGENYDVDGVEKPKTSVMWVLPEGTEKNLRYTWGRKVSISIKKKG